MDKRYLPGRRIIKTVVAVMLCLVFSKLVGYDTPLYAGLSCILVMKESPEKSLKHGVDRTFGTLYGGLLAMLSMVLGVGVDSWFYIGIIGLTMLVSLTTGKIFKMSEYTMTMSTIMILIVMLNYNHSITESVTYSLVRILETIVGIVIAVAVNTWLFREKHEDL